MQFKCNEYWLTTVTVPGLLVLMCYQIVLRKIRKCPPHLEAILHLPLTPYTASSFSISFGKVKHHQRMISGLPDSEEFGSIHDFVLTETNISVQSWGENQAISDWDDQVHMIAEHFRTKYPTASVSYLDQILGSSFNPRDFKGSGSTTTVHYEDYEAEIDDQMVSSSDELLRALDEAVEAEDAVRATKPAASQSIEPAAFISGSGIDRRNMSNAGGLCYISCPVQILANIATIRDAVLTDGPFPLNATSPAMRSLYGDRPNIMTAVGNVHAVLKPLFRKILSGGPQVQPSDSRALKSAMAQVNDEWKDERFNDTADFFAHLFFLILASTDILVSSDSDKVVLAEYDSEVKRREKAGHLPSMIEAYNEWCDIALSQEGNSVQFQAFRCSLVREGQCQEAGCSQISRSLALHPIFDLNDVTEGQFYDEPGPQWPVHSITGLLEAMFRGIYHEDKLHCPRVKEHAGYHTSRSRPVHVGDFVVCRINRRARRVQVDPTSEYTMYSPVHLEDYLDMQPLLDSPIPSDGAGVGLSSHVLQGSLYRLVAVTTLIPIKSHYVAYIDLNGINASTIADESAVQLSQTTTTTEKTDVPYKPQWVCFDDQTPQPYLCEETPTEFLKKDYDPTDKEAFQLACLAVYRRCPRPAAGIKRTKSDTGLASNKQQKPAEGSSPETAAAELMKAQDQAREKAERKELEAQEREQSEALKRADNERVKRQAALAESLARLQQFKSSSSAAGTGAAKETASEAGAGGTAPGSIEGGLQQLQQAILSIEKKVDDAAAAKVASDSQLAEFLKTQAEQQNSTTAATEKALDDMRMAITTTNTNINNLNERMTAMYRMQLLQRAAAINTNQAVLTAQETALAAQESALNAQRAVLNATLNAQQAALATQRTALAAERTTLAEELTAVQAELEKHL